MLSASPQSRRLVPQWRRFSLSATTAEFAMPARRSEDTRPRSLEPELIGRIERFRRNPTLVSAADLLESAVVLGQEALAVPAARVILRSDTAMPLVATQASALLRRAGFQDEVGPDSTGGLITPRDWRFRARLNPEDAFPWVELALAQLCNGHRDSARRSMRVALHLSPANRHVLRTAARLHFQLGEFDVAHDLLRRNANTPSDPWLMAAEIALSSFTERKPVFWKQGLALAESNDLAAGQVTELAGALGTQMLLDGGGRHGRKLMRLSQIAPTSNAIAQAEWVSLNLDGALVEASAFRAAPKAWEARSMQAFYEEGNFEKSLGCATLWVEEERYNPVAYAAAAVAANVMEDFAAARDWSRMGLMVARSFDPLHNTMAFAAACEGDFTAAESHLGRVIDERGAQSLIAIANRGLIAIRRGDIEAGDRLYDQATSGFRKMGSRELEGSAVAHHAAELAKAGKFDAAASVLVEAKRINKQAGVKHVQAVIGRVEGLLAQANGQAASGAATSAA